MNRYWEKFSFGVYRDKSGTKQFSAEVWWHKSRMGAAIYFWVWEISLMKERRG